MRLGNWFISNPDSSQQEILKTPINQNLIVKGAGHEQINKMLVAKNIAYKQIAFMFYGAYLGFTNLPKTFTNIIFDAYSDGLSRYVDDYLFNIINRKS